jgi:hypothetical protein
MSTTATATAVAPTFEIVTNSIGSFNVAVITTAGRSIVKNQFGEERTFSTRSSARKAITRLRRSL